MVVFPLQTNPFPVFSWCSSRNHYDIVLPTYKLTTGTVFGKDLEHVQLIDGKSGQFSDWDRKRTVLFFRGRPSNKARVDAMLLSKKHPDKLDARITKNQFNYFPDEQVCCMKQKKIYKIFLMSNSLSLRFRIRHA